MNKISVVINTYNAEARLQQVLDSVQDFDEVLVCDMESTDGTLDIARRNGCRIVTYPKAGCNSAEPARTFAIQSATHQWVLVVDADEVVPTALREYLYDQISRPDCPKGIYIPRKNEFMGHFMHSTYPDHQLRFFVKEGTVWPPYVHTLPVVVGRTERIPSQRTNLALLHYPDDTLYKRLAKTNAYTENEVVKRAGKHYGIATLLWKPGWKFLRSYFLKGGFRDGLPGLIWAIYDAIYQTVLISKIIERNKGVR